MSYQSPIEVIQTQLRNQIEDDVYKVVINVGVNVDKKELLKALQYDREQYQKGYKDRDDEIIRCKNCRRNHQCAIQFKFADADDEENWFCADGKRR